MPAENPRWLIMMYLSGDNDLSFEMVRAINELGALGAPHFIAITIQFDPVAPGASPLVYRLKPGEKVQQQANATIPSSGALVTVPANELLPSESGVSENAASEETLARFIQWSAEQFPGALNRLLILSGHGSGAIGDFLTDEDSGRGRTSSLTIRKLGRALTLARDRVAASPRIDDEHRKLLTGDRKLIQVLGMDSCLMSMGEVALEVAPQVEFLVGSEGFVPEAGWPYSFLLQELRKKIGGKEPIGPIDVSGYLVSEFLTFYRTYLPAGVSVDMAGCELSQPNLDRLTTAIGNLAKQIRFEEGQFAEPAVGNAVILAHWRSQSFKFEQYTDMWDFCNELRDQLRPIPQTASIISACEEVQKAINVLVGRAEDQGMVDESPVAGGRQGAEGVDFQYARGLSIYFPWSLPVDLASHTGNGDRQPAHFRALEPYGRLAFCSKTDWHQFLSNYLNATMRKPRAGNYLPVDSGLPGAVATGADGKKYAPDYGKYAPDYGKFAPDYGKYAPDYGKYAPDYGKFLALAFGNVPPGSMKNGPQRVEAPVIGQAMGVTPQTD
jgi:hypothetical protein